MNLPEEWEKLVKDVSGQGQVGSQRHSETVARLQAFGDYKIEQAFNKLASTIDENAKTNDALRKKIQWLNWIVALAAVAQVVVMILK